MFYNSGFKRTLCGSKWNTLKDQWAGARLGDKESKSTARYGCCPAKKYMSSPFITFSIDNSCSSCPSEFPTNVTTADNDEISCNGKCPASMYYSISLGCQFCQPGKYNDVASGDTLCKDCISEKYSIAGQSSCEYKVNTCPKGSYSSGTAACLLCAAGRFNDALAQTSESVCQLCAIGTCSVEGSAACSTCAKMPDGCKGKVWTDRDCDLRKAVDEMSADGSVEIYQPRYRLTYGPMKDWDISLVTDLKFAFYEKGSFNGDISKWQTQKVTTLWYSK